MFEVKIYGEIVPFQSLESDDYGYFSLTSLNNQLEKANKQPLLVCINSCGGDVDEGFAIYQALRRYATENKVEITTRCDGRCASIATVFFLAGDNRIVNEYIEPFVHNAWCYAVGDAKELTRISVDLQNCNNKVANHYALHTDLTFDEAIELMNNETYISASDCLKIRFATEIENVNRPKALERFNNKNNNKMIDKKKSILAKLEALFSDKGIKALEVFTETNDVLDFTDLDETETPKVGDKAIYKDAPATGEYVLADGITTYIFEAGVLSEIKEDSSSQLDAKDTEIADLKVQIAELTGVKDAEILALNTKISSFKALASEFKTELLNDKKSNETKDEKKEIINFKFKR